MGMMEEFYRKVAADKQQDNAATLATERDRLRVRVENLEKRLEERCRLVDEMEDAGVSTSAKVISLRALLREALEYTHHLPPCPLSDDTDGPCTCGRDGLLRRAEAEATEESEQKMNLQQALAILAREQHNGYARWDGTCRPGNPAWRTEFEVIAIAEAYERAREPDPCAAIGAEGERSAG